MNRLERKLAGRKKEGRVNLQSFLLRPTSGTFEIISFQLSNCDVNELESFSNFSRDYFARR